ncbi:FAD-dependent oxidoreductase [Rhodococcus erythropolis]|uniref:FAD-dependent oxidoreductase n=1 Tax=Rhodococcus erythropolis TaxID=1833 RepID=UPI00210D29BD|nr:FAD-dependent oxidoreductase [Rhodococcus erythropolis]MCQ4127543.1 FAD-dependent oxidoreductase [Rhodococcus erythropolis]
MTSLWLEGARPEYSSEFTEREYDTVVVGAGMTGVVTALLFARAGHEVALLESRTVGAVTTGNTTGKISLLQGTRLSSIAKKHSPSAVRSYVEANREGQQWLLRYCADNSVAVQRESAFTYTTSTDGTVSLREELDAARAAGLDAHWTDAVELPFPVVGALRLDDQAQFDAVQALDALIREFVRRGGTLHEGTRVRTVHGNRHRRSVHTNHGVVTAARVVIATGTPILDRGGFFARLEPQRSYAAAFAVPGDIPRGMYLSVDEPKRSIRYAPRNDSNLLLVGGNGHPVGRAASPSQCLQELIDWTGKTFPGAELTHSWSAQDYRPVNELPYVGELLPGDPSLLIATGYAKWGITNSVAAALALVTSVLGTGAPWSAIYSPWDWNQVSGVPHAVRVNAEVAVHLAGGWVKPLFDRLARKNPGSDSHGQVVWEGLTPVARSTVCGVTQEVSAVCPHLGGIVSWNDVERSWDCPLHGSRFTASGELLEGPATEDLSPS